MSFGIILRMYEVIYEWVKSTFERLFMAAWKVNFQVLGVYGVQQIFQSAEVGNWEWRRS